MKLGIIIDSACGLTKSQANERKWGFAPIIVTINNKEYRDGVDINAEEFYKMVNIDSEVKTATTSLGDIKNILEEELKKFDYIIIYPLSKELSAQTNNFTNSAKSFKNIFVVPSNNVGYSIVGDCDILIKMARENYSWEEIKNKALKLNNAQFGLATPKSMKWLVKGGRVSGVTASMAKLLKIVPIIKIENGKLEKFGKGRFFDKTVEKMAKSLKEKYKNNIDKFQFSVYHGDNKDIKKLIDDIKKYIPIADITYLPPVIGSHLGPGVISIVAHLKN